MKIQIWWQGLAFLMLLVAAPAFAQDPGLEKRLSDQGYGFEIDSDGDYKMVISWNSDRRSQVVFISGKTEDLNGMAIREIFAPAAEVKRDKITGAKALELMGQSAQMKLGSWEIIGKFLFFVVKVPDSLSATELDKVITLVAETADNKELELTRGKDEF
ncbi:MAG: hypothetical protein ACXIT4_09195 [Erythrobacter sp.]